VTYYASPNPFQHSLGMFKILVKMRSIAYNVRIICPPHMFQYPIDLTLIYIQERWNDREASPEGFAYSII